MRRVMAHVEEPLPSDLLKPVGRPVVVKCTRCHADNCYTEGDRNPSCGECRKPLT
jgi:hypothetical protein